MLFGSETSTQLPRVTRASTRATSRLGLLLLSVLVSAVLTYNVAATRQEAGLGTASVATSAAATAIKRPPTLPQLARSDNTARGQRRGTKRSPNELITHGESDAKMRVVAVLVMIVMLPLVVVVETVRSM